GGLPIRNFGVPRLASRQVQGPGSTQGRDSTDSCIARRFRGSQVTARRLIYGVVQRLPLQTGLADGHTCPQLPQLLASLVRSVHVPEQLVRPVGHMVVDVMLEVVVVVVDVVGHGVVRGRHLRTNASRSVRGLVPFAAVAFAESRTMAGFKRSVRARGKFSDAAV